MKTRAFGKTGFHISEIALGTWQLGSVWGEPFDSQNAFETLKHAVDSGINAFDTADVYQGGQSEKAIGEFIKKQDPKPFVITKVGRRLPKQTYEGYNEENIRGFIDDSRRNLDVEALDMVLLHCPPTSVYDNPSVFNLLDTLKDENKIKHYGVSIETVEEGFKALQYPGVEAIEIIFNMFRLKPLDAFFQAAHEKEVGIIVRVPLASGLLSGKFDQATTFNKDDHRAFNREGEFFDKGETFSGVDYDKGLEATNTLKAYFKTDQLAPIALRWILMFEAVSTVIPGASNAKQILNNAKAAQLPPLSEEDMAFVEAVYERFFKKDVHPQW